MVNKDFDQQKRLPLWQIAIERLGYTATKAKDSRLWRCLRSPSGDTILTRSTPNANGHYMYKSLSDDHAGSIIDLLLNNHQVEPKDALEFLGQKPIKTQPYVSPVPKTKWLKPSVIRDMYRRLKHEKTNFLSVYRGLAEETLKKFKIKCEESYTFFVFYRREEGKNIPSSIQKYFFDGKATTKRFQGSRGHAVNLLSPLPQKELKNPAIYFFESPIDALAYAQLNSVGDNSLLVSFGGMPPSAFLAKIGDFIAHWQASSYTICFDNDDAGIAGAEKLVGYLPKEEVAVILPPKELKDWGETATSSI